MTVTTTAHPIGHPRYGETLPREPGSAAVARRLVRASLTIWGLDDLAEDGVVIVCELVTNAIQHARRDTIRITVERPEDGCVRLCVVDFSTERPVLKAPGPEEEGGRGLALVDRLASDWGTELLPWGKRVWAELRGKNEG